MCNPPKRTQLNGNNIHNVHWHVQHRDTSIHYSRWISIYVKTIGPQKQINWSPWWPSMIFSLLPKNVLNTEYCISVKNYGRKRLRYFYFAEKLRSFAFAQFCLTQNSNPMEFYEILNPIIRTWYINSWSERTKIK